MYFIEQTTSNYNIENILCSSEILDSEMSEELPSVVALVVALKSTLSDILVDVSVVTGFAEIEQTETIYISIESCKMLNKQTL